MMGWAYGNGGVGMFGSITMLLMWVLLILGIIALWKYIKGKK